MQLNVGVTVIDMRGGGDPWKDFWSRLKKAESSKELREPRSGLGGVTQELLVDGK